MTNVPFGRVRSWEADVPHHALVQFLFTHLEFAVVLEVSEFRFGFTALHGFTNWLFRNGYLG